MAVNIEDDEHLDAELAEAGENLVVLCFVLFGNDASYKMLENLTFIAKQYNDSVIVLTVDVTILGELAKKYEAIQVPWFIFMQNGYKLKAFHSMSTREVGNTVRRLLGEEPHRTLKTYINDRDDLNRRLVEAGNKLVILTFLIPDDDTGQRLNIDLEEIEKNDDVVVLKVDVDVCKDVTSHYHIQGVPTLVFIKDRLKLDEFTGNDPDKLKSIIMKYNPLFSNVKEGGSVYNEAVGSQGSLQEPVSTSMEDPTKKFVFRTTD